MKVLLAGFNVDIEILKELKTDISNFTPETISAAYARISRSPKSVDELRKIARREVEKARSSNKKIIFDMGHHSIAEHAVFNFDIIGVSRLAVEEIEKFRICSYTEKSQRYVTLKNDFVVPPEIENSEFKTIFVKTIRLQNEFYHRLYQKLKEYVFRKYKKMAENHKNHSMLDGWAKEDARYIASLATQTQLGETINARNLELLFRRFASNELDEIRELGQRMYDLVEKVAPSIILFFDANEYDQKTHPALRKFTEGKMGKGKDGVELVNYTHNGDNITIAAILHKSSNMSFAECLKFVSSMSFDKQREVIKTSFRYMEFYDAVLREYEHIHLSYDIVVSASCFAQLKRHRMATITSQRYDPNLGVTIPESIYETGMDKKFQQIISKTEQTYDKIDKKLPGVAQYILTNAHRKRVLLSVNGRELYHISRLREDAYAQWDIRERTKKMVELARKVMPLTFLLIGGKDRYPELYEQVFGNSPKVTQTV